MCRAGHPLISLPRAGLDDNSIRQGATQEMSYLRRSLRRRTRISETRSEYSRFAPCWEYSPGIPPTNETMEQEIRDLLLSWTFGRVRRIHWNLNSIRRIRATYHQVRDCFALFLAVRNNLLHPDRPVSCLQLEAETAFHQRVATTPSPSSHIQRRASRDSRVDAFCCSRPSRGRRRENRRFSRPGDYRGYA